jgi:alkanesulfonate monooxygenase SsuD/methylene tetrahydromethanopterin reductase-like flavin-dependent oxidoreductase (luciferase family)
MRFGLFDHIDRSGDRSLAQQYDERLELIAAADEAGFFCYHLAEHHATPLNTVPVPGVFLGAVARATKRITMGPMVYLLPLYSPLRLIEEICILDHLSNGRLQPGVGRGVSPYELNFHHVDADKSRDIFVDAFDCISEGLTHDRLTYSGPYFTYEDVPMALRPLQQPHPPFWYGSSNTIGATWAGERGLHFVTNGGVTRAKENIDAFRAALATRGGTAAVPLDAFDGGVAVGASRHVYVAETEAEARRIAEPAHEHLAANLTFLRREAERKSSGALGNSYVAPPSAAGFDNAIADGSTIIGTPDQVRAEIERQAETLGLNYFVGYHMFGSMSLADAMRSLRLFTTEVMPKVRTPAPI